MVVSVGGTRTLADFVDGERPKSWDESILFYKAFGTAPFLALMSKMSSKIETLKDQEHHWWSEINAPIVLRVNQSGVTASTTTITVDGDNPSTSSPLVAYGDARSLKKGDMLLVNTAEKKDYSNEIIVVSEDPTTGTSIKVTRGGADTTAAAIPDNTYLTHISAAFEEASDFPTATSRNPLQWRNFMQTLKATYSLSGSKVAISTRTGDPLANERKRAGQMFKNSLEAALLWGKRSLSTSNGQATYTMGGLRSFIPERNVTIFGSGNTTLDLDNLMEATAKPFDYTSESSVMAESRVMLCGLSALNKIQKLLRTDSNTEINFGEVIKLYGMNLRSLVMPHGELMIKTHPLFNQHPVYQNAAFIVDFASLRQGTLPGRDVRHFEQDAKSPKEDWQIQRKDVVEGAWFGDRTLIVNNGGITQGYLYFG